MPTLGLNKLVGRACISQSFQAGLMNGRRAELIQLPEFGLEPDEAKALIAIKAESFADFAAAVEHLVEQRESRVARIDSPYLAPVRWPSRASMGVYYRQQR